MTSIAHLDLSPPEREAFGVIAYAMGRVTASRVSLTDAEANLRTVLASNLQLSPVLAASLYWEHGIGLTTLATALGMTQAQAKALIGTETVEAVCPCGDLFLVHCSSLTHLNRARSGKVQCLACDPRGAYGDPLRSGGRRDLDRLAVLRAMDYADYLQTQEWADTRDAALARARHACEVCSGKYGLDVHHRTYDRMGSEQPRDLLVLCRECHTLFHREGRLKR